MKIFNLKVETKKSGNAYYVAYYIINGKQKKFSSGVKCTGKKKDEKEAFDIISKQIIETEENSKKLVFGDREQPFVSFMEEYLKNRPYKTDSTKESYLKAFNAQIKPYFTKTKVTLANLKKADIEDFYAFLYMNRSPKYVKNIHSLITSALDAAQDRNLCRNVARGIKLIQPEDFANIVLYSDKDFISMIEASKRVDNSTVLINLLCRTGIRLGELQNLQWKNFDCNAQSLRIEKSKTAAGKRTLSIGQELCNILTEEKARQAKYKTIFAETYTSNDYIVKQIDGNPYSDKQVRDRVKKIMKFANLKVGRVHDIRHSVAVNLIEKNQNLYSISQYMGHKNLYSTMRYLHFTSVQNKEVANALNI